MNISYSAWKLYAECPKHYFLKHRKQAPPVIPLDDYHRMYGFLTERFFQMFCNHWRHQTPYMSPEMIRKKMKVLWDDLLRSTTVDWSSSRVTQTQNEIFDVAVMDVCAIMDSPSQNHFLNTKSEVEILVKTKGGTEIGGRLDFIHYEPLDDNLVHIFDGKGTTKVGRVDTNQLYFYALLYFFHYKRLPAGLGFFYYRFNLYKPLPIDLVRLNEFRAKVSLDVKAISTGSDFSATPGWKPCHFCEYQPTCQEYMAFRASRKKPSAIDLPDGVTEFGL